MGKTENEVHAELTQLAQRKLALMRQIHELRGEIRKVDEQLVKSESKDARLTTIIAAW